MSFSNTFNNDCHIVNWACDGGFDDGDNDDDDDDGCISER